jgi:hypothetical protein
VYGAPNGLCSSIIESKHIKAVKEPWRRSNRFDTLSQILLTNQHLDKLAASHVDFADHRMLQGTCLSYILEKLGMSSICSYCLIKLSLSLLTGINGSVYDSDNRAPAVPVVAADNNDADPEKNTDNKDNDGDAIAGPTVLASVNMAKTVRELISVCCVFTVA